MLTMKMTEVDEIMELIESTHKVGGGSDGQVSIASHFDNHAHSHPHHPILVLGK